MSVYGLTGPAVVFTLQRHHSPVSSSLMLMGNTRCRSSVFSFSSPKHTQEGKVHHLGCQVAQCRLELLPGTGSICVCFFLCFFAWFLQTAPSRPIQQPPLSTKEEVSRGSGEFVGSNISRPPTDQWHRLICQRTNFHTGSSTQTSCSFLPACVSKLMSARKTQPVDSI